MFMKRFQFDSRIASEENRRVFGVRKFYVN